MTGDQDIPVRDHVERLIQNQQNQTREIPCSPQNKIGFLLQACWQTSNEQELHIEMNAPLHGHFPTKQFSLHHRVAG